MCWMSVRDQPPTGTPRWLPACVASALQASPSLTDPLSQRSAHVASCRPANPPRGAGKEACFSSPGAISGVSCALLSTLGVSRLARTEHLIWKAVSDGVAQGGHPDEPRFGNETGLLHGAVARSWGRPVAFSRDAVSAGRDSWPRAGLWPVSG